MHHDELGVCIGICNKSHLLQLKVYFGPCCFPCVPGVSAGLSPASLITPPLQLTKHSDHPHSLRADFELVCLVPARDPSMCLCLCTCVCVTQSMSHAAERTQKPTCNSSSLKQCRLLQVTDLHQDLSCGSLKSFTGPIHDPSKVWGGSQDQQSHSGNSIPGT